MPDQKTFPAKPRRNGPPQAAERTATGRSGRMLDQPFDGTGMAELRSAVTAHAATVVSGEQLDDVVLVAHELATNAVRHGGGSGRLRLWQADGRIVCQVIDAGPGFVDPGDELPPPRQPGGRGLWIARQLAAVRIVTGPDGTTITATFG